MSSVSFAEKLSILEAIVKVPTYAVAGFTHGKLIYVTTQEGVRSLWLLDIKSGYKKKIAEGIWSVGDVIPRSPYVLYTKDVMRGREQHRAFIYNARTDETIEVESMPPQRIGGLAFDGNLFAVSGATQKSLSIWKINVHGEAEIIYETNRAIFVTSIENNIVGGIGFLSGDPKAMEMFFFDMKAQEFRVTTPKEGSTNKAPRIKNGKALFATSALGNDRLLLYDIKTDRICDVNLRFSDYNPDKYPQILSYDWLPDGRIWHIAEREGRSKVFVDGKLANLPEGYPVNVVMGDNKLYVTWSSLAKPARILAVDIKNESIEEVLADDLPEEIRSSLGDIRFIRYRSFDGLEIPAIVVESKKVGKPGPTIVYVHGGPFAHIADSWSIMITSLVALGFHVIAPNYRGSTGYGEEFRRLIIGDPGGGELMDIVHANKWAKESGLADKIAIMGYSYGGYMTLLATGRHPDIWDAGVAGAAVADWEEMYELSDAMFRNFIEVLFAGKRELYKERSPITYVESVKVPLCIIQPQNDTRTPLKPVLNYVTRLMEYQKTFELHVIPDMGHAIVRMDDAIKILYPAIIFLESKLKQQ